MANDLFTQIMQAIIPLLITFIVTLILGTPAG